MSLLTLFVSAFIIGLSGAMMPGPLLTYVINGSLRRGFIAGPLVIVGHSILEFILIILMLLGLNRLFSEPVFTSIIGVIGGTVLLVMGYNMIKSVIKKKISIEKEIQTKKEVTGFILPGAIISISNPYWILWWATIGMTYLVKASKVGMIGLTAFYFGHILSDFAWYSFVSGFIGYSRKLINDKIYRILIFIFGCILIYFAINFVYDGVNIIIDI